MKVAVLFGFSYEVEKPILRSSYIDLFTVYDYLSSKGFRQYVFSDFSSTETIEALWKEKNLEGKFLSFHNQISNGHLNKAPVVEETIFENQELMVDLNRCDSLFFYYTGHITKGGEFCFPKKPVSIARLLARFGSIVRDSCRIFCVVDGCYSNVRIFPYYFNGSEFALRANIDEKSFFMKQECVYLYSAGYEEKAVSSYYRSHFTKYLFSQLKEGIAGLSLLLAETQKRLENRRENAQTAGAVASYRLTSKVWPWVFGYEFIDFGDFLLVNK